VSTIVLLESDVSTVSQVDSETLSEHVFRLIQAASELIQWYCSRTFALTTYTAEKYNGTGTVMMVLNQGPVVGVSAVSVDGFFRKASLRWSRQLERSGR
jgi:hypothetical protein